MQAIKIAESKKINRPDIFEPLYATAQHYFGRLLNDKKEFNKADSIYTIALKSRYAYTKNEQDSLLLAANLRDAASNARLQKKWRKVPNTLTKH